MVRIPYTAETKECIDTLKQYMALVPSNAHQFFCHANLMPLTRYQFSAVLSKACKLAGFQVTIIKTHSFRIGRASDLALQGISDDLITSNSYARYIRL